MIKSAIPPTDTEELLRIIQKTQAFLARKGEVSTPRAYALLGRCFQALGQVDKARAFFRQAATKARTQAESEARPDQYADAAVFGRLADDDSQYQENLDLAFRGLAAAPSSRTLQTLIHVCFLREDYPAVIQYMAQFAASDPEWTGPDMAVYHEHRFAHAILAQDRAAMQRAADGLAELIILHDERVTETSGLSLFELVAHAQDVLARRDATQP
jgi:tetratricopeptide (TPR) repeat protein